MKTPTNVRELVEQLILLEKQVQRLQEENRALKNVNENARKLAVSLSSRTTKKSTFTNYEVKQHAIEISSDQMREKRYAGWLHDLNIVLHETLRCSILFPKSSQEQKLQEQTVLEGARIALEKEVFVTCVGVKTLVLIIFSSMIKRLSTSSSR
jgi:hypothetical protein